MTDDKPMLWCLDAVYAPPIPSLLRTCSHCLTQVWLDATMESEVEDGNLAMACEACARGYIEAHPEVEFAVHPTQKPTLADLGILDVVGDWVARVNRRRGL